MGPSVDSFGDGAFWQCVGLLRLGGALFRKQIDAGGPITLTQPDNHSLLHDHSGGGPASAPGGHLGRGGDVFLLNIGEPLRIKALAEQMVSQSGLSLRNAYNPGGDIEIVWTRLRPGEKLYGELLIDAESEATAHSLIHRARERSLPLEGLWPWIEALESAIQLQDLEGALRVLESLVPEWSRSGEPGGVESDLGVAQGA
jgi:FlaA1/EpsC-like NDP-sugar epimerase